MSGSVCGVFDFLIRSRIGGANRQRDDSASTVEVQAVVHITPTIAAVTAPEYADARQDVVGRPGLNSQEMDARQGQAGVDGSPGRADIGALEHKVMGVDLERVGWVHDQPIDGEGGSRAVQGEPRLTTSLNKESRLQAAFFDSIVGMFVNVRGGIWTRDLWGDERDTLIAGSFWFQVFDALAVLLLQPRAAFSNPFRATEGIQDF